MMQADVAALQLMTTRGLGTVTLRRVLLQLAHEDRPLHDFVAAAPTANLTPYGIKPAIARGISATLDDASVLSHRLNQQQIHIHWLGSPSYPARLAETLGETAPPILFSRGNMTILERHGIGFCGSRHASELGLGVAKDTSLVLTQHRFNIISGYAHGVDLAAHRAALEAGGVTTLVLAEGILHFRQKHEIKGLLTEDNHLIISEFLPQLGWLARNAMQRNRTIVGLADATVVIEAGATGGTFAAGETALQLRRPLFVVVYANPEASAEGNAVLLQRGAQPLRADREGKPNIAPLLLGVGSPSPQTERQQTTDKAGETSNYQKPKVAINPDPVLLSIQAADVPLKQQEKPIHETRSQQPMTYRKKLIEVALPLKEINEAAAREKSIRHGHPSTLHLWWARRPLAACRSVLFASLVDDPTSLPHLFPTEAEQGAERQRLFEIIKQLVIWENSNNPTVLLDAQREIARSAARTKGKELATDTLNTAAQVAEALRQYAPPMLDPFAGGGSIPLEAQRLGLQAHASDLNPVAVLINKALIEIPPQFADQPPVNLERRGEHQNAAWPGAHGLADDVRYYGRWMRDEAQRRIGHLYPTVTLPSAYGGGEATVIAWLWARTVRCPNPACGAQMPLISSFELSKKAGRHTWVEPQIDRTTTPPTISYTIASGTGTPPPSPKQGRGAKFRCVACGEIAADQYIKDEGVAHRMGSQLMAIVAEGSKGRVFLPPNEQHAKIVTQVQPEWKPNQLLANDPRSIWCVNYGLTTFADLFTSRQLVALTTFADLVNDAAAQVIADGGDKARAVAVATYLGMGVSKASDYWSNICIWRSDSKNLGIGHVFARQTIQMAWDYAEANPFSKSSGNFNNSVEALSLSLDSSITNLLGHSEQRDATTTLNGFGRVLLSTDPPYYDNIGYADLADFFYVWLKHTLQGVYPDLFGSELTPKEREMVATPYRFGGSKARAEQHFETGLNHVFALACEKQIPDYPMTVFYAFKQSETEEGNGTLAVASTGWEKMLEGLVQAGFSVTGTWPMRTEMLNRPVASGTNALASSIVLVCRPRPVAARIATRREFRDTLRRELGAALRDLQRGTIAPVDLGQAAIGPGMAVYSRFREVQEADGTRLSVRTALGLINGELDRLLYEQEGDYDVLTRFCVAWFEEYGFDVRPYGEADTMAHAKNIVVTALNDTGIFEAKAGKARLCRRDELADDWSPKTVEHLTAWAVLQHCVRAHAQHTQGEAAVAAILRYAYAVSDTVRDLAYRLYVSCDRKGWAEEAFVYNALVASWSEIIKLVVKSGYAPEQGTLLTS